MGAPHISTGDMLRTHIAAADDIGLRAEALIKSGKLVPDELVNELVEKRLSQPDVKAGVILDGYPRTLNQADVLLAFLRKHRFRPFVVYLVVDHERIVRRLSGRRQCPVCGTLYSIKTHPPKVSGICDLDGSPLITREDDRESVIRQRLEDYDVQTAPLLNYFRQTGVPVIDVKGASATPEAIQQRIFRGLAEVGLVLGTGAREEAAPEASVS
jgi:adenylate kinase